ncbi:MAG: hypothetical protein EOM05_02875 [Clostridia bacterium]|nr:hypothetical protein [Clostridia bacterium]
MANERKTAGVNVGGASIIMVFSVLCLTIFAVLTLVSANAESTLAKKSATVISNYYVADENATETLAKVYEIVGGESSLQDIKVKTAGLSNDISTTEEAGLLYILYSEKIDDSQNLNVKLRTDGDKVDVLTWKVESTAQWEPDTGLNVWQG